MLALEQQMVPSVLPRVSELNPLQVPLAFEGDMFLQDMAPSRMVCSNPEALSSQPHKPESEEVGLRAGKSWGAAAAGQRQMLTHACLLSPASMSRLTRPSLAPILEAFSPGHPWFQQPEQLVNDRT
jgi:hypothetical protein